MQNYGDESDAYGLMYPSLYSNKGVYEQDFFMPRSQEEVKFRSIRLSPLLPQSLVMHRWLTCKFATTGPRHLLQHGSALER